MSPSNTAKRPRSRAPRWNRKLHRLGAALSALPLVAVIVSGLLLQLKKQSDWIQPLTLRGSTTRLEVPWDSILQSARSIPEAGVETWDDIDRLDVRPSKGMLKVRARSRWEIQIDAATGEVLGSNYRRSDLIESIHDGSFFGGDAVKLGVFLPAGLVLFGLWVSGIYLWLLPYLVRRQRRGQAA